LKKNGFFQKFCVTIYLSWVAGAQPIFFWLVSGKEGIRAAQVAAQFHGNQILSIFSVWRPIYAQGKKFHGHWSFTLGVGLCGYRASQVIAGQP
jgi:hypothetical protein